MSCISQITNIKKVDSNIVIKIISNIIIYLDLSLNYYSTTKNTLYITKIVVHLQISHNKNKITQKNNLTNKLYKKFYLPSYIK